MEGSLRRLGTDYIDLYQLHGFDALTPIEEALATLDDLVRAGKIRYIGCSNFSGWHLMKSLAVSEKYGLARYVAHQAYYSLVGRDFEWELMPLALDQKSARWSGVRSDGADSPARSAAVSRCRKTSRLRTQIAAIRAPRPDEPLYHVVDALDVIATETGKTVPQIALNWLLQRPTVATLIIGARNEEQLRQNLGRPRMESDARASRDARRSEHHDAGVSLLASDGVRGTESITVQCDCDEFQGDKHESITDRDCLCTHRLDRLGPEPLAVHRGPDLLRDSRCDGGGQDVGDHLRGRPRAERTAHGAGQTQCDRALCGGTDCRATRQCARVPIMPFSPAGDPVAKTGHMRFPGTVSISSEVFLGVMRQAAQSAAAAGFKNIFLMGDHGGGQSELRVAAEGVDADWRAKGVRVYYISDVNTKAGQQINAYLKEKNIVGGGHAAVAETAQVMFLDQGKTLIHADKFSVSAAGPETTTGVGGNPAPATAELGHQFLEFKITAAIDQIKTLMAQK